jgi:hypothetical protein
MVDHNIYVEKTNKLEGSFNYQAWKIKVRTIYKRKYLGGCLYKNQYCIFPIIINGAQIAEN